MRPLTIPGCGGTVFRRARHAHARYGRRRRGPAALTAPPKHETCGPALADDQTLILPSVRARGVAACRATCDCAGRLAAKRLAGPGRPSAARSAATVSAGIRAKPFTASISSRGWDEDARSPEAAERPEGSRCSTIGGVIEALARIRGRKAILLGRPCGRGEGRCSGDAAARWRGHGPDGDAGRPHPRHLDRRGADRLGRGEPCRRRGRARRGRHLDLVDDHAPVARPKAKLRWHALIWVMWLLLWSGESCSRRRHPQRLAHNPRSSARPARQTPDHALCDRAVCDLWQLRQQLWDETLSTGELIKAIEADRRTTASTAGRSTPSPGTEGMRRPRMPRWHRS